MWSIASMLISRLMMWSILRSRRRNTHIDPINEMSPTMMLRIVYGWLVKKIR